MYIEGTLRPPTSGERQNKYLELETIELEWLDENDWVVKEGKRRIGEIYVRTDAHEPTVMELSHFVIMNDIPANARIVYHECGTHQIALDWNED